MGTDQLDQTRLTVVGAGRSGRAAARLGRDKGAEVLLVDANAGAVDAQTRRELERQGIEVRTGEHRISDFAQADRVVLSPGIPLAAISPLLPPDMPVLSELELALRWVRVPIIAVTGTNGKTTTVRLIDHILRAHGIPCFLGGNIGVPLSEYVWQEQEVQVVVLEVSSFQLQHTWSLQPRVAVWLNFSANHLDHHAHIKEYWQAKRKLFARQSEQDMALVHKGLWPDLQQDAFTRAKVQVFDREHDFGCPNLWGAHNGSNMEAAFLACRPWGIDAKGAQEAMHSFTPSAHRLQPVARKKGVLYVNDSKATTVEALRAALESFDRPIHLLAGGRFKGGDLGSVLSVLRQRVHSVCLFGESRELFTRTWGHVVPVTWRPSLEEAVMHMASTAASGEVVLLSPATSSFDLFANYQQRGEAFIQAVDNLEGQAA